MAVNSMGNSETEKPSDGAIADEWDVGHVPRRMAHPKPRLTLGWLLAYLLSPLQPAPKLVDSIQTKSIKGPRERRYVGRRSSQRRRKRLRKLHWLRFVRVVKRTIYTLVFLCIAMTVAFWAKFAIVYHVPHYLQVGQLSNVQTYVAYKSWWFGPPMFNLAKYPLIDPTNPEQSLMMHLQQYKNIVTNPTVVYVFLKHGT